MNQRALSRGSGTENETASSARARPFARAVLAVYAARAVLGWLIALPLSRTVRASGVARLADGDAALFQPGALFLAELVRSAGPVLQAGLESLALFGLIALTLLALPSAYLFASAPKARAFAPAWPRALGLTPRFVLVGVLEALMIALVLLGFALAGSTLAATLEDGSSSERTQSLVVLGLLAPGLGMLALVRIAADVLRARVTRGGARWPGMFADVLADLRRAPWTLFAAYTLAAGNALLLLALTSRGVELLHVDQPGAWRVLLVTLLHQLTLLGLSVIHALWVRRVDGAIP